MKGIIAVNNLGFIGKDNKLLWRNVEDLQHFKNLTVNTTLLVGWNTYMNMPELSNRVTILDDRNSKIDLDLIDWCIGGKRTYEKYSPHFTELHISHINDNSIGDIQQPDWSNLNSECKIYNYHF